MSEQLQHRGERLADNINLSSESEHNLKRLQEIGRQYQENQQEAVETSLQKAKSEAVSGHEVTIGERETTSHGHAPGLQKELKADAYKRTMSRVQGDLKGPEKAFSKVIHQPTVEKISDLSARTIARPSGILGGSITALLGSILLVYLARHYGFTYNYLFFSLLFVVGFIAGSGIEAVSRMVRGRR